MLECDVHNQVVHQTLWRRVENLLVIRKDFFLSKLSQSGAPDYYVERRDDDANDRIVVCTDWTNLNIRRQTKGYARLLIRADACAQRYARAFDTYYVV